MAYVHPWHVRYYEVDQQGVVFNGWYLSWFDEALTGFIRHQGLSNAQMEEEDIDYMLVRSEIDWHAGVRYDDEISIAVEPSRIGNTSFDVRFSVLRDGEVTCTATIVYVSISRSGSGKQPVPDPLRKVLVLSGMSKDLGDEPVEYRKGLGEEMAVVPGNQGSAETVKHRPALIDVAAVLVFDRVQEVDVANVRPDRVPVVAVPEDRLVTGVGRCGVARDEECLGDRVIELLQEREQQRGTAGVPDEHGFLVAGVGAEYLRQHRGDRLDIDAGVMRNLHAVPAACQPFCEPRVPDPFGPGTSAVEDDRLFRHGVMTVLGPGIHRADG